MKRLENIEDKNEKQLDKIKYQGEKQLDITDKQGKKQLNAIKKAEKQLKKSKIKKRLLVEKIEKEEKSGKIIMLEDNLNDILNMFETRFNTNNGENIVKKFAKDDRTINYNYLFFKKGCPSIDFLKKFGTLYDLLIGLLNEKINTLKAAKQQNEMIS